MNRNTLFQQAFPHTALSYGLKLVTLCDVPFEIVTSDNNVSSWVSVHAG